MKVPADRQRQLLDLAEVDAELARLDHQVAHLPEDVTLAELDERLDAARTDSVRAEIAAEDLDREYRRVDGEVTGMASREKKDSALLTAGGLAPKALSELQHELAGLGRRRGILEDEQLAIMEQQEAVTAEQQRAAAVIDQIGAEQDKVREQRDKARGELSEELDGARQRRDGLAAEIDPELYRIYSAQRSAGRIGAGLLQARRCGACRMELDRGTLSRISTAPDDEVIRCDECGAVLVRTAHSGLPV